MLMSLPQTEAISNLKNSYEHVMGRLLRGPVLLMQRSKPAAVLVSVTDWQRASQRLAELEEREMIRQRVANAHADPSADLELGDFLGMLESSNAA